MLKILKSIEQNGCSDQKNVITKIFQILSIFFYSRPIDAQCGKPDKIREVLDKALFQRTQEMMHGKGGANQQKPKKYVFYF